MARHEFKAFVGGDEFIVEDHANYVTIRNAYTGNRILDVHKDTAAELVAILEYMGLTLKNNDLSIEEAERMELDLGEIMKALNDGAGEFMDLEIFSDWSEEEKRNTRGFLTNYNVWAVTVIMKAEIIKLNKMAEAEVEE